jgi:hypothetical protein
MAAVCLFFASHNPQQGSFATAVWPDKAHSFAKIDGEGNIFQDGIQAVRFANLVGRNCHVYVDWFILKE